MTFFGSTVVPRGRPARRAASVVATATALIGALQLENPTPAKADYCIGGISYFGSSFDTSGWCYDEFLAELIGSTLFVPQEAPAQSVTSFGELKPMLDEAGLALNNDACNALITGGFNYPAERLRARQEARTDALAVLIDPGGSKIIPIEARSQQNPDEIARVVIDNGVDVPFSDAPDGIGKGGDILIFMPRLRELSNVLDKFILQPGAREFIVSNAIPVTVPLKVLQAIVLLHELAHLTGGNGHPAGDPDREFNRAILSTCFNYRIGRPAPNPQLPPRPGTPRP